MHLGGRTTSAQNARRTSVGSLTQSAKKFGQNGLLKAKGSSFRTDLGIPRAVGVVNQPELVRGEKDPILQIAYGGWVRDSQKRQIRGGDTQ